MGTNIDVALNWIEYAEKDLKATKLLFDKNEEFYSICIFLTHQSAEKAIKAILVIKEIRFPKTHDLNKLLSLMEHHIDFETKMYMLISAFENVNTEVRYPESEIILSQEDIEQCIAASEEIIKIAKKKISV